MNGHTEQFMSFKHPEAKNEMFKWCYIFGDPSQGTMLTASMTVDEVAKYSEPLRTVLQNVQIRDPQVLAAKDETTSQSTTEPLQETKVNGIRLVPKKFLQGRIEMLVPASFSPMSDEMAQLKYPSGNRPSEILTNETGSINVAFTYSKQVVAPNQLGQMHKSMDQLFRTIHKTAEWHNSGLKTLNNRQLRLRWT